MNDFGKNIFNGIKKFPVGQLLYITVIYSILSIVVSCSSVKPCPEKVAEGNISSPVNTSEDEFSPFVYDKEFFYTTRKIDESDFRIWTGSFTKNLVTNTLPSNDKSLNSVYNAGLIKLYRFNQLNRTFAFFAGINENSKIPNSDIYSSFKNDRDVWVKPDALDEINTVNYESFPALSPDGMTLVFASDRPEGMGGIDLYKSVKDANGYWGKPVNLGKNINSEKDEISPYINIDGSLLYSSNNNSTDNTFDIILAAADENGSWKNSHILPPPINTKYDEKGAFLHNNQVMFASNRPGGCGGYDIYSFRHCGDVVLEGSVEGEKPEIPLDGKLYLFDSNRELLKVFNIDSKGKFSFELVASNIYFLQYFNSCLPNYVPEQMLVAPCSDTTVVKIVVKFIMPFSSRKFDFANYKVPFFVSGYYLPNTPQSLENLRLKFAYNLFGNNPETNYIEKPGDEYDDYAITVQGALNDAVEHIKRIFETTSEDCLNNSKIFKIKVIGFADPRTISEFSTFAEESIGDLDFKFSITKGDKIDNLKLSELRAYFTSKYIQSKLKTALKPDQFKRIKWESEGRGIDEGDKANELKRRVNIEIGVVE